MDTTLPEPVQLRLEQALSCWRQWRAAPGERPRPERVLAGGRSNTSVLAGDGQRRWVVRLDGFDPGRLGLNRNIEWHSLQRAAARRLAPEPVYYNPDLGALVCVWCEPEPAAPDSPAAVAALLRDIHSLPPLKYRLNPLQRARRYAELAGMESIPGSLLETLERLAADPAVPRLCHNDLLAANRLFSDGRLLALDWEYAAMGDPLFDLAAVIEGDELTDTQALELHQAWLQRTPDDAEAARLEDQRSVYRNLSTLWQLAIDTLRA